MPFDLIIFDCDGTLVDSEYLCNRVIADMMAERGLLQYDVEYVLRNFAGLSAPVAFRTIEEQSGRILPPGIIGEYERRVNGAMPEHLRFIEGVPETLGILSGKYDVGVGSNGERSTVLLSLRYAGLDRFFPEHAVFTKDMVQNPKPAPDIYLMAAQTMGADPLRALVVEDTVAGVRAGKAAGMTVIGLTATYHDKKGHESALRAAGADRVTDRFIHIPALANTENIF